MLSTIGGCRLRRLLSVSLLCAAGLFALLVSVYDKNTDDKFGIGGADINIPANVSGVNQVLRQTLGAYNRQVSWPTYRSEIWTAVGKLSVHVCCK